MSKTIDDKEYARLLKAERKLSALEAGGVDNWEWYSESLKKYFKEEEFDETLADLASDICTEASLNMEAPVDGCSGSISSDGYDAVLKLLQDNVKELKADD